MYVLYIAVIQIHSRLPVSLKQTDIISSWYFDGGYTNSC